jgi:hypothetical protein
VTTISEFGGALGRPRARVGPRLGGVAVAAVGAVVQFAGALLDGDLSRTLLIGGVALTVLGAALALGGPIVFAPGRGPVLGLVSCCAALALVGAGAVAIHRGTRGHETQRVTAARATAATTTGGSTGTAAAAAGHDHGASTGGNIGVRNADQHAELQPDKPLDVATREKLAGQLVVARDAAMKYPTVADAKAAGMYLAGKFTPGAGAHYMSMRGVTGGIKNGETDPASPASFIYDGISPTSKIVGLMYISMSAGPAPEGFAGPNDHWHRHFNTCVRYAGGAIEVPFPADSDVTQAMCDAQHGTFMKTTVWMVHAWVVPGWESPKGVFSHDNPDLLCADGTANTDAIGFCPGT